MKGYIKRLLREGLLNEADNREFLKTKLGLSDLKAEFAHKISDKHSIWIGNQIKNIPDSELNTLKNDFIKIISLFKIDNKPKTDIKTLTYEKAFNLYLLYTQFIKDWLNSDEVRNANIKHLTWHEAEVKATEWHDSLGDGGELEDNILDDKDEIIHKFDDGFMWVLHKDNKCKSSEKSMGHCGVASEDEMYLLRLIKGNEEFITGDWHPNDKYMIQLKGKKNDKPNSKYHKYILWLLLEWGNIHELNTSEGHRPETNFHLSDLNVEDYNEVISRAPELLNKSEVERYFFNIYDNYQGDEKFYKLKEAISELMMNNNFMSKINFTWVRQIIRFSKNDKVNLANTLIDKLIDKNYFKRGFKDYYDFEYVIKNYNNPLKFLMNYNVNRLVEHIIVDDYNQNLLRIINPKYLNSVIDYLVSIESIGGNPDVYEVFLDMYVGNKDELINKFLEYYKNSNGSLFGVETKWVCYALLKNSSNPQIIYDALGKETFDAIWYGLSEEDMVKDASECKNPKEVYRLFKSVDKEEKLTESIILRHLKKY